MNYKDVKIYEYTKTVIWLLKLLKEIGSIQIFKVWIKSNGMKIQYH